MVHGSNARAQTRIDNLSQRTRRFLAAATLAGLPGMYLWAAFWQTTSVPNYVWGPVSFLLIGFTVVGSLVLYRFVRDRADLRSARLDERQRQLRDRAFVLSYGVLSTVLVALVAIVALLVLGMGQVVQLDGAIVSAAAISVGVLLPVLPVAALAWIEPDAPADA